MKLLATVKIDSIQYRMVISDGLIRVQLYKNRRWSDVPDSVFDSVSDILHKAMEGGGQ